MLMTNEELIKKILPNIKPYKNQDYNYVVKWTFYKHRVVYVGYNNTWNQNFIIPIEEVKHINSYIYILPFWDDEFYFYVSYKDSTLCISLICDDEDWLYDNDDINLTNINNINININKVLKTIQKKYDQHCFEVPLDLKKIKDYLNWIITQLCLIVLK